MKVGASYYPETLPVADWQSDLETARETGLTALRCGEFAWSAFSPDGRAWAADWARRFLDLAQAAGHEVIWCTPSATPPPYLFGRWPDLHAVNVDGRVMPVGIRRHYCPSHPGYLALCAETAERLAHDLAGHPAVRGWQIDNEIAGDGFTCWCERCRRGFQDWLRQRYGTLDRLNDAWQTRVWSQLYTDWNQIPVPHKFIGGHTPAIRLAYRRFRSDLWLRFYLNQYAALHRGGARTVTTNFYNLTWDVPFDQWCWRPHLDALGISHYIEEPVASRFQLALLRGASPGDRPLWVLEQKAGQQNAQNYCPEDLSRLERHLRICAEAGAEYAIYWHLRQHAAGCESEHGAVLRHDGRPTRIAQAVRAAIAATRDVRPVLPAPERLLAFSFEQHWANENRHQPGTPWDYRTEVEQNWYAAAGDVFGDIRVGPFAAAAEHSLVLMPFFQMAEPGLVEALHRALHNGATLVVTADFGRLDVENNVCRQPPLAALAEFVVMPDIEILHLRQGFEVKGEIGGVPIAGRLFHAVPEGQGPGEALGILSDDGATTPAAWVFRVGSGRLVVTLAALDRPGVAALLRVL